MRTTVTILILIVLASCARADHIESFGFLLEYQYGGVVPVVQQAALADNVVTPAEVEAAVTASLECMAAIDGVVVDEAFNWREDGIEFGGGAHPIPGTDESVLVPQMDACYFENAALVETAWLDQQHFGSFTTENLQR
ncbi:MAG: hypothetical protein QNL12_10860 [Acidimicrobiia bacterium]|nr:hypothetical protein [Acidimicrobiia bacterium]MDX2467805.1 hypothetical protein [Acidimicrobiia bacterium]